MRLAWLVATVILVISASVLLIGCGGTAQSWPADPADALIGDAADLGTETQLSEGWPYVLPADSLQPWEILANDGHAEIAQNRQSVDRIASGINASSEFVAGYKRYIESGDVTDLDDASRLNSGIAGSGEVSFAQYRILMEGQQPGTLSADVNLRLRNDGTPSAYWLGLSDYSGNKWEWHGPFSDAHVRLSLPDGDYLTSLGNLFVNVVACDGATFDVIGIGANPREADSVAPAQVSGLTAIAVASGLDLQWNSVIAGDLVGYRIYYSNSWFLDQHAGGLKTVPFLEGNTRHMLLGLSHSAFVRVSAVDLSGNEGELSEFVTATPLSGHAPALGVTTSKASGSIGMSATLTATGAESYDWDLDGDGVYDVTGDDSGTAQADTSRTGIIRPAVRGLSNGSAAVACGAVSLLISGNARPVANGYADPSSGPAPLTVDFAGTGTDPDGEIVLYSWDFDGNGSYDWSHATNSNPPPQTYNVPYLRNVKFRIDDDLGAYDVDTISVQILAPAQNTPPLAKIVTDRLAGNAPLYVSFDASGSYDLDGSIVKYEWDWNSDGVYDSDAGTNPETLHVWYSPGYLRVTLRVTDDDGASDTDFVALTARGPYITMPDIADEVGSYCSLAKANNYPAIAYYDETNAALKFVRALDRDGIDWDEPVTVDSDPYHDLGRYASLAVVNGRPAISYHLGSGTTDLLYVQAVDNNGSSWKDPITVDDGSGVGIYTKLVLVANQPAIAYFDWVNEDVMYIRADDINGDSWSDTPVVAGHVGGGVEALQPCLSMAIINGRPAVAYYDMDNDRLLYRRSDDNYGSSWTDAVYTVDDSSDVGRHPSLAAVRGYPVIAYFDVTNNRLKYCSAEDFNGTDWRNPIVLDDDPYTGEYTNLAVVNDRPVICYRRNEYTTEWVSRLRYIRALDSVGITWGLPVELVNVGDAGDFNSVAQINGSLAIGYYQGMGANLAYTLIIE